MFRESEASRGRFRPGQRAQRGVILMVVLFTSLIILAITGSVMRLGVHQTRDRQRYETYKDEFAAAEEAVNKTYAHIQFLITQGTPDFFNEVSAITPPVIEGFNFPLFSVTNTFNGNESVTSGQWEGLELYRLRYNIQVRALKVGGVADLGDHPGVGLSQNLEITYIPLFNFAIFYDPVMEIAPGPAMEVLGRIHANGDAYFQANSSLKVHGRTTVAGNFYHGRHSESGKSDSYGSVLFNDGTGSFVNMNTGEGWLDSESSSWTASALTRWNGYVKDNAHGVKPLSLPIPTVADNHDLIERADPDNDSYSLKQEKFEYKAGLKIIRESGTVTGYLQDGTVVPLTYTDEAGDEHAIYGLTSFWDEREDKMVSVLDIDLQKMIEGNIVPANGILYVSNDESINDDDDMAAVRLINGTELPDSGIVEGFSVATDDPIYIQGDYNTVNKTVAMVAGDSIGILSNAWEDSESQSNGQDFNARNASDTTVNTVCIQGVVPSANNNYSGGVENYFRFLEKWSGDDFVFEGSIIQLWESEIALGKWHYGSPVYTAPNRIWSWDTSLVGINGPPGAPRVFEINQFQWELENIFGEVES